jgi:uncharacterized protein
MKTPAPSILLLLLLLTYSILPAADIPYLTGRVTDNAEILSEAARQALTASLKEHEDRTSNQIVILTIPTINGQSIEEYTVEVFEAWKLGQKGKDNGLLIVIVPNDRKMRIEVGYGLEAVLPDVIAGRIIQLVMTPRFKDGDYDGGISDGVRAVIQVLEGGELAEIESTASVSAESGGLDFEGPDLSIKERILIGAFIFGIIGLFTVIGVITPGMGWFLYFFLIPFWATFPIIVLGTGGAFICLISYVIAFPVAKLLLKNTDWYKKAGKDLRTKGSASIGGFRLSSGASGKSWSSGGSSFSGGGGSSGGGGASGSW